MRGVYKVRGFFSDFNAGGKLMQNQDFQVNVTKDRIGCTVSIADPDRQIQMTIPFDQILKDLTRR